MPDAERSPYADLIRERLDAGDDPNTIIWSFFGALEDAVKGEWRHTSGFTWIPAVIVWCVRCGVVYGSNYAGRWIEDARDMKCHAPGHNAPLLTQAEWDAYQAAQGVAS